VARGHVENLEQEVSKDEDKIRILTETCEKLKDSLENIRIERDTAQRGLDNLKNEKNILEQQRKALASELDSAVKIKTSLSTNLMKVIFESLPFLSVYQFQINNSDSLLKLLSVRKPLMHLEKKLRR
jgi:chromosome segregation ATPase